MTEPIYCSECEEEMFPGEEFVCEECGMNFCERCFPKHEDACIEEAEAAWKK